MAIFIQTSQQTRKKVAGKDYSKAGCVPIRSKRWVERCESFGRPQKISGRQGIEHVSNTHNLLQSHTMASRATILGILLLITAARADDSSAAIRLTPQAVFARYVEALGGAEAISKVHTAHIKVALHTDNRGVRLAWIDRYDDESGKFYEEGEDVSTSGWRQGFDGKQYWFVSLFQGRLWRLTDTKAKRYSYSLQHVGILREFPPADKPAEVIGAAQLGLGKAIVVRVPANDGSSSLYYFDGKTGLLVRTDIPVRWRRWGYKGQELKASNDSDWGLVDTCDYKLYEPEPSTKVLFPRQIECKAGGWVGIYDVSKVEVNFPIDPKLFKEPALPQNP
jgi:hypothetical protein